MRVPSLKKKFRRENPSGRSVSGRRRPASALEYAVAAVVLQGESESGDHYAVVSTMSGTLISVVDGLGHGTEAAQAARVAVETLRQFVEEPLAALVERCHCAMRHTRGAAMSLAWYNEREQNVTLLSVGNVDGVLLRAGAQTGTQHEYIQLRAGVVGSHLPTLRADVIPVRPGDVLILATDGIRSGFEANVPMSAPAQFIADTICRQHNKGIDDALVLVARFPGVEQ